ncbi:MAG: FAD-dependent oxidoreductase [Chloroflexi bacterium]|nr:FAD-dependent oxidoreductase [Chloroflexota bacterium]
MGREIGLYICAGCGIGEAIDVDRLCSVAAEEYGAVAISHAFLCGQEGIELIGRDIVGDGLRRVVIAACSVRVNWDKFSFDSLVVERVNLREHVAWSHRPNDENTQMLAEDYLRMGIVRAQKTELTQPDVESVSKSIFVVGGGISGMTAALDAVRAGYEVVLVEKERSLGGWLARFHRLSPKHPPYRALEEPDVETTLRELRENPRVRIFTSTQKVVLIPGPGAFDVTVTQNGNEPFDFRVGSIVLATGWQPYDATRLESLGFGKHANVVTGVMIEEMARDGKIARPSDGRSPASVAFIQCAGSRDKDHLPYCSSACCIASLKQAVYIREQNPDANVFIIYKDMRTPGQYEDFYRRVQEDPGIFFTKGDVAGISGDSNGSLVVDVENAALGPRIKIRADLVVLATGMVPNAAQTGALHLQYRQGPELPTPRYGFPDSNYICFPYETQRTAIYAAGCARQPMDVLTSMEDATGAAAKAIQSLELTARGAAVHPRAGDTSFPSFFLQRCTQCKRCTEECPFGALDEDERGTPKPNLTRCRRCGICFGACPERLISYRDYSIDQISSMIKAINVPEEEDQIRILGLFCENDALVALDTAGSNRIVYDPSVRVIPLRCLGSMNVVLIADAISRGIDGVLMMGCKYGDDYQCHFIKGSDLANRRMQNIQETLQRLAVEPERVRLVQLSISEYDRIPQIIDEFVDDMRKIGPNPYKGF